MNSYSITETNNYSNIFEMYYSNVLYWIIILTFILNNYSSVLRKYCKEKSFKDKL